MEHEAVTAIEDAHFAAAEAWYCPNCGSHMDQADIDYAMDSVAAGGGPVCRSCGGIVVCDWCGEPIGDDDLKRVDDDLYHERCATHVYSLPGETEGKGGPG
jgi:hypothetical protein